MKHCCIDSFESYEQEASDIVADMSDKDVLDRAKDLIPSSLDSAMKSLREDLEEAIYERLKYGE